MPYAQNFRQAPGRKCTEVDWIPTLSRKATNHTLVLRSGVRSFILFPRPEEYLASLATQGNDRRIGRSRPSFHWAATISPACMAALRMNAGPNPSRQ